VSKEIDPVTLAVLNGRLEQIADEMDATLFRSAFNPIIAEAHDASHGLYHARTGETLVQGKLGLPIFVGAMSFAVKTVIDKLAREDAQAQPGDVYIFHDVGGNVPGNYNPAATESFQEGMLIPPVKLFEGGQLRQDIVDILMSNSRLPGSLYGDLHGQINALRIGEHRLHSLLDDYGEAVVEDALRVLKKRAAVLMGDYIDELPDGVYSAEDYLDNDGIVDEPLTIALDIKVDGARMTLDFSRTAPPCRGPVNISRSTAIACCYVALKHVFQDVPANAGVLEPIDFVIPESSLLNATAPSWPCPRRVPTRSTVVLTARSMRCHSPVTAPTAHVG